MLDTFDFSSSSIIIDFANTCITIYSLSEHPIRKQLLPIVCSVYTWSPHKSLTASFMKIEYLLFILQFNLNKAMFF
jgi:hypothetical protein